MNKRILIDLIKCRECEKCIVECDYPHHPNNNGMIDLHEMAVFNFTCRRCEDAPCIEVCPAEALERDSLGVVERATNLCVSCKSCMAACPFGTLMNQFFEVRKSICDFCQFDENTLSLRCIRTCPFGALSLTDEAPNEASYIFELNNRLLVKEFAWEKINEIK